MAKRFLKNIKAKNLICIVLTAVVFMLSFDGFSLFSEAADEAAFQKSLAQFPESYQDNLTSIHKKYPNWTFTAEYVGLDWDTALAAESAYGVSLVASSSIASWKSTMTTGNAYDPSTGTWKGLDGSSWVQASVSIVEYYMDPRSYLDSNYIFVFLDQSYDSNLESAYKSGLSSVLKDTFMEGSFTDPSPDSSSDSKEYSYADVFFEAGKTYGASPLVLAASVIIEQGTSGSSGSISGTESGYEGLYNYFNVGAYAANGLTAIPRGLWYAGGQGTGATSYGRPWDTRYKSIMGGTEFFAASYVNAGQNTLYYKKFNVSPNSKSTVYSHQYMTNIQGAASEAYKISEASSSLSDEVLNFIIPVYENMPSSAVTKPTSTTVGAGDVSSSGKVAIVDGTLTVLSESISAKMSTSYTVSGSVISGVAAGAKVSKIISNLGISGGSAAIYSSSGTKLGDSEKAGTGALVYIYNSSGGTQGTYYLAVMGDLNGDGNISAVDLLRVQKYLLGITSLDSAQSAAADVSGDGKVSAVDLLKIQKHLLGVSLIS